MQMILEKANHISVYQCRRKTVFSNDNIVVKDRDGKVKHQSTCYRLFMVCVIGNISITSGLIQRSKKFGFSICLMSTTFRYTRLLEQEWKEIL